MQDKNTMPHVHELVLSHDDLCSGWLSYFFVCFVL